MSTPRRAWTFEAAAAIVRDRSGNVCEVCRGAHGSAVNTHHRQPRGMGGVAGEGLAVNSPACLIRLCAWCHNFIESRREWARRMGYLVPRPGDPGAVPVKLRTVNGAGWFLLVEDGHCYRWLDLPEDWSALESVPAEAA